MINKHTVVSKEPGPVHLDVFERHYTGTRSYELER